MHHFKAKGGTHFNFNSDLSGDVRVHRSAEHDDRAELPAADLLEFVEWYRRTPGYGVDEEALDETLTEEERALIAAPGASATEGKLLRLHDALQARVKELGTTPSPETTAALLMRERHAIDRWRTLAYAWAEQLRDLLPRVGLRALESVPEEVKALLEKNRVASMSDDPLDY